MPGISATGATFSDVPITITRSASSRSWPIRRCENASGRSSPKKVISGYLIISRKENWLSFNDSDSDVPSSRQEWEYHSLRSPNCRQNLVFDDLFSGIRSSCVFFFSFRKAELLAALCKQHIQEAPLPFEHARKFAHPGPGACT